MAMAHYAHHLPIRLTPFVGRQTDLNRLVDLLQNPSVRLVTILGAGGVGKTCLALELARLLHNQFQHGALFIPLAQSRTIDELLPALAEALGVQLPPGGDLQQAVLEHFTGQQKLLILDNFEHLLDEAALITDILVHGPQVKVLVTSREKLNLEVETLYHLGGLQLPPLDSLQNPAECDAVRLFLQKASQVQPVFTLNISNTPAVIQICNLVDGNALGILLAAAWIEHFSPAEIAIEISNNLDFLSRQVRDAEPRHFGMRAVFDSSFNRLDENLQVVFRKLAVFRGGFDLAAAQSVAGADLPALIGLVDKSLLTRDPDTDRYELHELLRQYADERLAAASDREKILAVYVAYYVAFVHQREQQLISPAQTEALDEIQADFDNIRQACSMVIDKRNAVSIRSVLPGLYAFCDMRSRFYDGEAIFREAVERLAPQAGERPHSAWALALLSWYDMHNYMELLASHEEIASQARSCLEQAKLSGDAQGTAASLTLLGAIAQHQSDFKVAIPNYEAAMRACPSLDDFYWINMRIGMSYQADQHYDEAIRAFGVCLQRGRRTGEKVKEGWSLQNIGDTLFLQGKVAEAEGYLEQALPLFQQVGTGTGLLWTSYSLSRASISLGKLDRAQELAQAASNIARELHSASWIQKTDDLLQEIDPKFARIFNEPKGQENETFSSRELEVLELLKSNLSGPDIARRLIVSLNTVRYHTKNIYRKLGVGTRLEAIQRAKELGL